MEEYEGILFLLGGRVLVQYICELIPPLPSANGIAKEESYTFPPLPLLIFGAVRIIKSFNLKKSHGRQIQSLEQTVKPGRVFVILATIKKSFKP